MEHVQPHSLSHASFQKLASHRKIPLDCYQHSETFSVTVHSPPKDFNMTSQDGQRLACFMKTGQL